MQKKYKVILLGYGGHSTVVIETLIDLGFEIYGYLDKSEKTNNPFKISYLGLENTFLSKKIAKNYNYFITVGSNKIRNKLSKIFISKKIELINIIHPSSEISNHINIGNGVFISKNVTINYGVTIQNNVIINSSSIIEHHSKIADCVHIGPGAVVLGNVKIGKNSFVGANSTIKEGIEIGENVIIGAGSVVIDNIDNNSVYVGNPAKFLKKNE